MIDLKELIETLNDGFEIFKKVVKIDNVEHVIFIRKIYDNLFFGAWTKKYYRERKYSGESWEFSKVSSSYYMEHEKFEDNLETWDCNNEILYYRELLAKQFYEILEEFIEWYNQAEDKTFGILEVMDFVKSHFKV
ncbi:hypothetical protein DRP04_15430 [Archaeoglobales archaeon]|nr:MAG: hypothetical protein DRP04_15430 [Archaeoglobales archaeon]